MTLEESITSLLTSDDPVSAMIGDRVYPMVIPQNKKLPAIAYRRVSGVFPGSVSGADNNLKARIQVDCCCDDYAEAKTLGKAVRKAMTSAGHLVQGERDVWDEESNIFSASLDFSCWHREA